MSGQRTIARRRTAGSRSYANGCDAERTAEAALVGDGWTILGRRLRTPAGEIDLVAERAGIVAMVEVKFRPTLAEAAYAVQPRQQRRLAAAAEILLGENPAWGQAGIRFDVVLVDRTGAVRRVVDAFRVEAG